MICTGVPKKEMFMRNLKMTLSTLFLAFVCLLTASCRGEETTIEFDRDAAKYAEAVPEFVLKVLLEDENGKALSSSSKVKLRDGSLRSRISFDYESTLSRRIGLLYFIDGIPQKYSLDGSPEAFYHKLEMPDPGTHGISCVPASGVGGDNASVTLAVFTDAEPSVCYSGDYGELSEFALGFRADLSGAETGNTVVGHGGERTSLEKLALDSLPTEAELARERAFGVETDVEAMKQSALSFVRELSETEEAVTAVNSVGIRSVLRQRRVVSSDSADVENAQLCFEAVGKAERKYLTTLFIDGEPCRSFSDAGTLEWWVEKGELFRYEFSPELFEGYRESEMFAVTLTEDGDELFVTPRILYFNTTERVDTAKLGVGMRMELFYADGKAVYGVQKFTGGDLDYRVEVRSTFSLSQKMHFFILADGLPVETVFNGESGVMHPFELRPAETGSYSLSIPHEQLPSGRFALTFGLCQRYVGDWLNPLLTDPSITRPSLIVWFTPDGVWKDGLTDEDIKPLINRSFRGWSADPEGVSSTGGFDVLLGEDQVFRYHGICDADGVDYVSCAFFNGEPVAFENGEKIFRWGGKAGELVPIDVRVPASMLKKANDLRLITGKLYKGELYAGDTAFAAVRAHGRAEGDRIGFYYDDYSVYVDSEKKNLRLSLHLSRDDEDGVYIVSGATGFRCSRSLSGREREALFTGELYGADILEISEEGGKTRVAGYRYTAVENLPF